MYSNFMFLDSIFFSYHTQTNTHRYTHKDSDDYSIVAFCKSATITYCKQLCHRQPQTQPTWFKTNWETHIPWNTKCIELSA